jgi:hypothetical protein
VLNDATWGKHAQVAGATATSADVRLVVKMLEEAYVDTVTDYRTLVYTYGPSRMAKFYPAKVQ